MVMCGKLNVSKLNTSIFQYLNNIQPSIQRLLSMFYDFIRYSLILFNIEQSHLTFNNHTLYPTGHAVVNA